MLISAVLETHWKSIVFKPNGSIFLLPPLFEETMETVAKMDLINMSAKAQIIFNKIVFIFSE